MDSKMRRTGSLGIPIYSTKPNVIVGITLDSYYLRHKKNDKMCRAIIIDNYLVFEAKDGIVYTSLFDNTTIEK